MSVKMHQYMVWAPDHTDEGALARRLAVRHKHLVGINKIIKQGVLSQSAILFPQLSGLTDHASNGQRLLVHSWRQDPRMQNRTT
jgi:hypothetical protein